MMRRRASGNAGFTLVELIVVIAILAILAGVGTAAYSGYITRANRAADETLIADIQRALVTGAYTDNYAPNTVIGAVSLSKDAPAAANSSDLDGDGADDGSVQAMLVNTFGANWAETLQLKSDAFTSSDNNKVLAAIQKAQAAAAAGTGKNYFASVNGSSFYNKEGSTEQLAKDVDEVASALNSVLNGIGGAGFNAFWGEDFHESVNNAGLNNDYTANTEEGRQMAANLSVFAAANQINNASDTEKEEMVNNWTNGTSMSLGGNGYVAGAAMNFAQYNAFVNYFESNWNDPAFNGKYVATDAEDLRADYNAMVGNLANLEKGLNSWGDAYMTVLNNFGSSLETGYYADAMAKWRGGPAKQDAEAFIASLTAVNALEDTYVNKDQTTTLTSSNAFATSGAADVLDAMVNYASMGNLPAGDYVLVLSIDENGTPVVE